MKEVTKSDNAFPWISAHISGFNIGAPIKYANSIPHVSDKCPKRGLMTMNGQIPIEKHYHLVCYLRNRIQRSVMGWSRCQLSPRAGRPEDLVKLKAVCSRDLDQTHDRLRDPFLFYHTFCVYALVVHDCHRLSARTLFFQTGNTIESCSNGLAQAIRNVHDHWPNCYMVSA